MNWQIGILFMLGVSLATIGWFVLSDGHPDGWRFLGGICLLGSGYIWGRLGAVPQTKKAPPGAETDGGVSETS